MSTSKRGFASMSPERRKEVARSGGLSTQNRGKGHKFTPQEAAAAGRKGGLAVSADRQHMADIGRKGGKTVSRDREHMSEIGSKGGGTFDRVIAHVSQIGSVGRIGDLLIDPERLLTTHQTCLILGLTSAQTLAVWRSTGRHGLPFLRIGRAIRYRAKDVSNWIKSRTVVPASEPGA